MKATVTKCDVCGEALSETSRRFMLNAYLAVNRGNRLQDLSRHAEDICGEACLLAAFKAMVAEVQIQPDRLGRFVVSEAVARC